MINETNLKKKQNKSGIQLPPIFSVQSQGSLVGPSFRKWAFNFGPNPERRMDRNSGQESGPKTQSIRSV